MTTEISISNSLTVDVDVYDSYSGDAGGGDNGDQNNTYFGQLTKLGGITASGNGQVKAIHQPVSTLIVMDTKGNPIARFVSMFGKNSFELTTDDVAAMALATKFVNAITQNRDSELAKRFAALENGADKDYVKSVDNFFASSQDYQKLSFPLYMMALTTAARNPKKTPDLPVEKQPYSIATLCRYLGGSWPDGFPDILVTNFKCSNSNDVLVIKGTLRLQDLPFENTTVAQEFLSLVPLETVEAEFALNMKMGLNLFGPRMRFTVPNFHIPSGGGGSVTIARPSIELDISPTFMFVIFKASAAIPFDVFNKKFTASISMVIDNIEMEIGATLNTDPTGLQAPPPIKGVFFDEFGVGMGVIFEPPSVAVGLEGKFHIGQGDNQVQLDDDTFALVCAFEEEVPNPLYLAFNVPELDFSKAVEVFTDKSVAIDLPVTLKELSMRWSENPLEPVVLPDGSLTEMGYGFSGYLELLSFRFFGDVDIGAGGLQGTIEASPLTIGKIFSLTGDGKGVKVKVDGKGNIIKNNQIPKTAAIKKAIDDAPVKQIVPAGGPELTVSTSSSPFFTLGFKIMVLEATLDKTQVEVSKTGIEFDLDYGAVLSSKMKCGLKNYHNFAGSFSFGLDRSISLPNVTGFHLGTLPLKAEFGAVLTIDSSSSETDVSVRGDFDFEDLNRKIGPLKLDINISAISDVIKEVENKITSEAGTIFRDLFNVGEQWAKNVKKEIIAGISGARQVAQGLKQAFRQDAKQVAQTMKNVGYEMQDVGTALAGTFVGSGEVVADALVAAFKPSPKNLQSVLKAAGYTSKEVGNILKGLGGAFASLGNDILKGLSKLDPRKW